MLFLFFQQDLSKDVSVCPKSNSYLSLKNIKDAKRNNDGVERPRLATPTESPRPTLRQHESNLSNFRKDVVDYLDDGEKEISFTEVLVWNESINALIIPARGSLDGSAGGWWRQERYSRMVETRQHLTTSLTLNNTEFCKDKNKLHSI